MDVKTEDSDFLCKTFQVLPENIETEKHEPDKDFIFIIFFKLNTTIAHEILHHIRDVYDVVSFRMEKRTKR